ncbi:activating signal cointegrator 1 complex subunit 3 isoform X3 [Dendrobates tinctorius]|uniref:activating signal cointegrator 1 complex subunit 3 isoform X3 n=1 Tax=Dendrobates tinctorius TaxID=92724 RepID=UPI003CC9962C
MVLPRLTGALRSFSNVTRQDDYRGDSTDLMNKRSKLREQVLESDLTWRKITQFVTGIVDKEHEAINEGLKEILQAAKRIVGTDHGQEAIESGAVFLFRTFYDKDCVNQEATKAIKQMFGPFPSTCAAAACDASYKIVSLLTDEQRQKLTPMVQEDSARDTASFGRNVKFSLEMYELEETEDMPLNGELETDDNLSFNFLKLQNGLKDGYLDPSRATQKVSSSEDDGSLLYEEVEKYVVQSSVGGHTVEDLCNTIFEMLASSKSSDELQNELFELLGPEGFTLMKVLLQHRQKIVAKSLNWQNDDQYNFQEFHKKNATDGGKPNYGCQVTVQSEQEKQLMRQYRREEKRHAKREKRVGDEGEISGEGLIGFDPKELRMQREQALLNARIVPILGRERDYGERFVFPHVYDSYAEAMKTSAFVGGAKLLLPEGIQRENNKMYEEVKIPVTEPMPIGLEEKPIFIKDLDEIGQLVFKGVKRLNRIQSIVFETAYNTNENMLICAPTGAGKTNIAMLTVLHVIRQNIHQGVIKKDDFKIVYVAPMKALAAEMTNYFSKRLEPLGITVKELTGDMQLSKGEILRTQMLVTTPEKWDVVTRKSVGDVALSQLVRLLILDEVHLLHEDRGPVLESLVARTLRQVESTQSMIRILGLSATLPNYLDVATFLHVNPYIGLFYFDGRFRPVPLGQTFIGIKSTNKTQQLHDMEEVCYENVLKEIRAGRQVMVFVHARNSTVRTAMALRELAKNNGHILYFLPNQGSDYGHAEKQLSI